MKKITAIISIMFLSACSGGVKKPDHMELTRVSYSSIPEWRADKMLEIVEPIKKSCAVLLAKDPSDSFGGLKAFGRNAHWAEPCRAISNRAFAGDNDVRSMLENYFTPYLVTNNGEPKGLVTGYYEADVNVSKRRNAEYNYPVYRQPEDLTKPYFSRKEIDEGALKAKGLEIAWARDPVQVFFMQVQGSGRLVFSDGEIRRVGYAEQNGHPYVSIGKTLIDMGVFERGKANAPAIIDWLKNNPDKAFEVMHSNPSYVFFKETDSAPKGAQGVEVAPMRTIAVDKKFIPLGVPVFLVTDVPQTPNYTYEKMNRLMMAQDIGGAIKGPTRADVFFGSGAMAAEKAGYMKQEGMFYVLLPKGVEPTAAIVAGL